MLRRTETFSMLPPLQFGLVLGICHQRSGYALGVRPRARSCTQSRSMGPHPQETRQQALSYQPEPMRISVATIHIMPNPVNKPAAYAR
jgi:hypothetical protein